MQPVARWGFLMENEICTSMPEHRAESGQFHRKSKLGHYQHCGFMQKAEQVVTGHKRPRRRHRRIINWPDVAKAH